MVPAAAPAMAPAAGSGAGSLGEALAGGYSLALGLPRSPVWAVVFILAVLTIVYVLLTAFIRVGVPSSGAVRGEVEEVSEDEDEEPEPARPTSFGTKEEPYSDWGERSGPPDDEEDDIAPVAIPESEPRPAPEPPIRVESMYVHGTRIALGDTASQVMRAFRPGEGEMTPLIERNASGEACHVTRTYVVGRQPLTLVLAREHREEPLTLVEILLGK